MSIEKTHAIIKKIVRGVWVFLLVSETLFDNNQILKLALNFAEVVEQHIFFLVTVDISGPFRQIWKYECLQFRIDTELLDDLKA